MQPEDIWIGSQETMRENILLMQAGGRLRKELTERIVATTINWDIGKLGKFQQIKHFVLPYATVEKN